MAFVDESTIHAADFAELYSRRQQMSSEIKDASLTVSEIERLAAERTARRKAAEEKLAEATLVLELALHEEVQGLNRLLDVKQHRQDLDAAVKILDDEMDRRDLLSKKRHTAYLYQALPFGTPLHLTSRGVTWNLVFTKEGYQFGRTTFKSPTAVTTAHSSMIHEGHAAATLPGSGWLWLKVSKGVHAGKSIGSVYDAYFKC